MTISKNNCRGEVDGDVAEMDAIVSEDVDGDDGETDPDVYTTKHTMGQSG